MDSLSPERRSWNMGRIKSRNTGAECAVRSVLHRMGYRFRIHRKDLPGKPDIVMPKYKTVIFVNGCFWHRHRGCKRFNIPKSNQQFWISKIEKNVKRDHMNKRLLKREGWLTLTIWECQTKKDDQLEKLIVRLFSTRMDFY